ncbi:hypothetical protein D3C85_1517670 [compost metagenome]
MNIRGPLLQFSYELFPFLYNFNTMLRELLIPYFKHGGHITATTPGLLEHVVALDQHLLILLQMI